MIGIMNRMLRIIGICVCFWAVGIVGVSGQIKKFQMSKKVVAKSVGEKLVKPQEIVSVEKFVKPTARVYRGMFTVYVQEGRFFVEIPERLFGRDMAAMQVLVKGSGQNERAATQLLGYAGDPLSTRLVRFEKGGKDEVWLIEPEGDKWMKDTTSEIYRLVRMVEKRSVAMAFDILELVVSFLSFLS